MFTKNHVKAGLVCLFLFHGIAYCLTFEDSIQTVATRLVNKQKNGTGDLAGSWPNEANFTGSIVPGLLRAYEITGNPDYLASARLAGEYILRVAAANNGSFIGDETYALTRLSDLSDNPQQNPWRTALVEFFEKVRNSSSGTNGVIEYFIQSDPSDAVFDLSHYLVAAKYVDAVDFPIWRQGVIDFLSTVEDGYAAYPVMSLGVAVWALSQTGPLDDTLVSPSADEQSYWYLVRLSDLPGMLLGHQVPPGEEQAGSFYWRFDHTDGDPARNRPISGYTEDCIYGALGLKAWGLAHNDSSVFEAVAAAQNVLLLAPNSYGKVRTHIWSGGDAYHVYAGEYLRIVPWPIDLSRDDTVDFADIALFAGQWLSSDCISPYWCAGADLNRNGVVSYMDFQEIAQKYGDFLDK